MSVRIAAVGDLHFGRTSPGTLQKLFAEIAVAADVLLLPGDLTDYGLPEEARALAREIGQTAKIPIVSVLGNHDFESGHAVEVAEILREGGVVVLDGDAYEIHGVGIAGVKGFCGGFGRHALGSWGEPVIKAFVQESLAEVLKLETALARLRTPDEDCAPSLRAGPGHRDRRAGTNLSVSRVEPARGADQPAQRDDGLSRPRTSGTARGPHVERYSGLQRLVSAAASYDAGARRTG